MVITYKYRIKDSNARISLCKYSYAVNQVWNYCVETQKKVQKIRKQGLANNWPTLFDLTRLTSGTSKELGIHAQTICGVDKQFIDSRNQYKVCPKFRKSFGAQRSLGWVPFSEQSRQITQNSVTYLGKTYKFFGAKRRPLPSNATGGCFAEDSRGHWHVCFWVEEAVDICHGYGKIGIDLGTKTLAATSDGQKIENIRSYKKLEKKLGIAQRAGNKRQARAIHAKIKNVRQDHLHKESSRLIKENCLIVVGDVSSTKLVKTKMAKSVLDAGWYGFKQMLRYKASRHGVLYKEVNESFTTQTCSQCEDRSTPGRPKGIAGLGIRSWTCSKCGTVHDRDVNAAKNILAIGLGTQPRVDENRDSPMSTIARLRVSIGV